jgi:hypothetical protein
VRPVTLCAVTITVLVTICVLACVFYVGVLFQWMRDTKAKTTPAPTVGNEGGETSEKKLPYIVDSRRAAERDDRTTVRSLQVPRSKNSRAVANQGAMGANGLRTSGSRER